MHYTFKNCSRGDIFGSPKNWETTTSKATLKKDWFIQCFFIDPAYKQKYPRGFQYRVKANKGNPTLDRRKAAMRFIIDEMTRLLDVEGFNPITGKFMLDQAMVMAPVPVEIDYNKDTPLLLALDMAFEMTKVEEHTRKDIKSVLNYFKASCTKLGFENKAVNRFLPIHAIKALQEVRTKRSKNAEPAPLSDKRYNKYIAYLSGLFTVLHDNKMVDSNIFDKLDKNNVFVEARETLTQEERERIDNYTRVHFPEFNRFLNIFFHSGGREEELMRLQVKDVCLDYGQESYTTLVKKGKLYERIKRPIKKIAIPFWDRLLLDADKEHYVFSEGLRPGPKPIRREQVTRRWNVHIKKKLGITADLYSLKHSNLTEISSKASATTAAKAAGHKTTKMVENVYDKDFEQREFAKIRNVRNHFGAIHNDGLRKFNCAESTFAIVMNNRVVEIGQRVPAGKNKTYDFEFLRNRKEPA